MTALYELALPYLPMIPFAIVFAFGGIAIALEFLEWRKQRGH